MSKFFIEILDKDKIEVFEQLRAFRHERYLVGGTALALQLGHRISVDFDLFSNIKISFQDREKAVKIFGDNLHFTADNQNQLTFLTAKQVKVTFAYTPNRPLHALIVDELLPLPLLSIADIASDKAFVIGRRAAYRDYVDLYFILRFGISLETVVEEAKRRYGAMFEEKLFLEQLEFMGDLKDRQINFVGESNTSEEIYKFLHQQIRSHLIKRKTVI